MRSLFRFWVVLLIALMVIAPIGTPIVKAQGEVCLPGLQKADCDLMAAAGKNEATSFTMAYSLKVKVTGIKDDTGAAQDVDLSIDGTGPLSFDKSKLPADMKTTDLASLMKGVAGLTMGNTIKFDIKAGGQSQAGNLEFRILNSKFYYTSDNADLYPSDQKDAVGKWLVVALDAASLGSMGGSSLSGIMAGATMGSSSAEAAQQLMTQLVAVPGFITAKRTDANDEATFTIDINIATLLKSKEFLPIVQGIMAMSGGAAGGQTMDPKQVNAMVAMIAPFFNDLKITITSIVGTKDQLTHGFGLHIALKLTADQMTQLQALSGGTPSENAPSALDADINFMFKMSDLNKPVSLEAPADAIPVSQ
jgi:hypothetical protein